MLPSVSLLKNNIHSANLDFIFSAVHILQIAFLPPSERAQLQFLFCSSLNFSARIATACTRNTTSLQPAGAVE